MPFPFPHEIMIQTFHPFYSFKTAFKSDILLRNVWGLRFDIDITKKRTGPRRPNHLQASSSTSSYQSFLLSSHKRYHSNKSQSSRIWLQRHLKDPYVHRAQKDRSPSRAIYKLEQIDAMVKNYHRGKMGMDRKRTGISTRDDEAKSTITHPHGLFRQGDTVIELGASPGGWTLYASQRLGNDGLIVACDLLDMDKTCVQNIARNTQCSKLEIIYGDFNQPLVQHHIIQALKLRKNHRDMTLDLIPKADCIMSDMAVNFSGDRLTDALRTMNLCTNALHFTIGGNLLDTTKESQRQQSLLRKGGSFLCKFFPCGKLHEEDLLETAKKTFRYTAVFKPAASRKESSEMYLYAGDFLGTWID